MAAPVYQAAGQLSRRLHSAFSISTIKPVTSLPLVGVGLTGISAFVGAGRLLPAYHVSLAPLRQLAAIIPRPGPQDKPAEPGNPASARGHVSPSRLH
jgi:hypothetical protein